MMKPSQINPESIDRFLEAIAKALDLPRKQVDDILLHDQPVVINPQKLRRSPGNKHTQMRACGQ